MAVLYEPDSRGYIRVPHGKVQFYAQRLIQSLQNDLGKFTVVTNLGFEVRISADDVMTVTIIEDNY